MKIFFLPMATAQPITDWHSLSNEKPLQFKLPVTSSGLFLHNSFSQIPLFAIKEGSSHLFFGLAYRLCHTLHSPTCNCLLFLSKPIFAEKKTTLCFIFKVNIIYTCSTVSLTNI